MAFNEDNVTEQMCIEVAKQAGYEYITADELREAKNDVIVQPLLQEALIKINHITRSKTPVRDFYLKIFGGFRIIAYICNMKTKKLYMNIRQPALKTPLPAANGSGHLAAWIFMFHPVNS